MPLVARSDHLRSNAELATLTDGERVAYLQGALDPHILEAGLQMLLLRAARAHNHFYLSEDSASWLGTGDVGGTADLNQLYQDISDDSSSSACK